MAPGGAVVSRSRMRGRLRLRSRPLEYVNGSGPVHVFGIAETQAQASTPSG